MTRHEEALKAVEKLIEDRDVMVKQIRRLQYEKTLLEADIAELLASGGLARYLLKPNFSAIKRQLTFP